MFLVDMREKKISFINSTNYNSNACQKDQKEEDVTYVNKKEKFYKEEKKNFTESCHSI